MRITTINGQEYSDDLIRRLEKDRRAQLNDKNAKPSSKHDSITILFEKEDSMQLYLPLHSNFVSLRNFTNYEGLLRRSPLKFLLYGPIERVSAECLEDFLRQLSETNLTSLEVIRHFNIAPETGSEELLEVVDKFPLVVDPWTINLGKLRCEYSPTAEGIRDAKEHFTMAAAHCVLVDPQSHVRVEKRARGKTTTYEASLTVGLHKSIGIYDMDTTTIRARTRSF